MNLFSSPFLRRESLPSLNREHLVVDLPHGELSAEDGRDREVPAVPGVARRHHVLRAEHLPGEVGHRLGSSVSPGVPACGWLVRRPDVAPLQCTWSGSQNQVC